MARKAPPMISATRTNNPPCGFTLFEIVIVLALAAVLMGGALGIMVFTSDERTLKNVTGEIELMAKKARTIAILHQTPYALEFREGVVRLLPLAQAGMGEKQRMRDLESDSSDEASGSKNRQLILDAGVTVSIRRWNSDEWLTTTKDTIHVWRFDPDGLSEPISVRVNYGKSWMEDTFHPLNATAILSEKSSEIR
jgi:prepilin-type N-terminal cleavage/methylation domain-containing protein